MQKIVLSYSINAWFCPVKNASHSLHPLALTYLLGLFLVTTQFLSRLSCTLVQKLLCTVVQRPKFTLQYLRDSVLKGKSVPESVSAVMRGEKSVMVLIFSAETQFDRPTAVHIPRDSSTFYVYRLTRRE